MTKLFEFSLLALIVTDKDLTFKFVSHIRDSTTTHSKIKLRVCIYFPLCIDVVKDG